MKIKDTRLASARVLKRRRDKENKNKEKHQGLLSDLSAVP
jgi:hypothetical protein